MDPQLSFNLQLPNYWVSLVAQMVKNLPAMQEMWVRSLGWEDSLEKGMAAHSNILPCRIPWIEEPGGLQSMGSQRVRHNRVTNSQYPSLTLRTSELEKVAICMFLFTFRWQKALFFWPPPHLLEWPRCYIQWQKTIGRPLRDSKQQRQSWKRKNWKTYFLISKLILETTVIKTLW